MKKKILINIISLICFGALFVLFLNNGFPDWFRNNACKTLTNRVKEQNFVGVLNDKYQNKKSHLDETLIIDNNGKMLKLIVPTDKSGLYTFIEVGDSISKEKESMECYVKRDGIIKRFEIDFGCK
ncbi:MAG: hypothetical protein CVU09_01495 [Bacteroidetes bacterium HGW-Bacteroidetes-4]|jgi:hypothetical protein|nr:MAG: hypothetical protein CVU09_01495 [Bacteroidetes bacterium HGW-Bacteroidetes-4]